MYEIEQTVYSIVGYPFMINSVQQLRKVVNGIKIILIKQYL